MMNCSRWLVPLLCLMLVSCSARVGGEEGEFTLVVLDAGQDGRNSSGGYTAELITDRQQLESLWGGLGRQFMGSSKAPLPEIDFSTKRVLFLSMGQQSSAGYRLELAAERLTFSNQTGIVRVLWQTPPQDGMQAQVLTAPYLVLQIPAAELSELQVLDQESRLRARLVLSR